MGITSKDNGYASLVKKVFDLSKQHPVIKVGILAKDGDKPHGDDALTVLQIAVFNEFGTSKIPERSFIRAWFDANEGVIKERLTALMRSVVKEKRTPGDILEILGGWCVGQIQSRISQGITPGNAESTLRKKAPKTTPLIDTGVLRASVSYRVEGLSSTKEGGAK